MSTAVILPMVWATAQTQKPVQTEMPRKELVQATPEMAFYRKYTEGMLRRYMKLSMESGRVPSMLGREIFRGKVTNYRVNSFEDVVIFVTDVERAMAELDKTAQTLLKRIAIQEYTHGEVAGMLGMSVRSVIRRYNESADELTAIFLRKGLLIPLVESYAGKTCQGGA
ncbi:sigma factor-like helix-turn-helix DNA-binding protein [Terriglobus saanensis]|nr:sigma factor-like helix-turn-helix DNA-binding protein [Terriglobus saanensis]